MHKFNEAAIWNWLVVSSADPGKVSLFVKGIVVAVVPYLLQFLPYIGLHPSLDFHNVGDGVYTIVFSFLSIIAGVMAIYGAARKIWFSITGQASTVN